MKSFKMQYVRYVGQFLFVQHREIVSWIRSLTHCGRHPATEINRSYQMSSFVETKALELLTKSPVEFVEYPSLYKLTCWEI